MVHQGEARAAAWTVEHPVGVQEADHPAPVTAPGLQDLEHRRVVDRLAEVAGPGFLNVFLAAAFAWHGDPDIEGVLSVSGGPTYARVVAEGRIHPASGWIFRRWRLNPR